MDSCNDRCIRHNPGLEVVLSFVVVTIGEIINPDIRPRRPGGGPDQGRDLEALFENRVLAFGAVAFVNNANDSAAQKRQIKRKFRADLRAAWQHKPDLIGQKACAGCLRRLVMLPLVNEFRSTLLAGRIWCSENCCLEILIATIRRF